MGKAYLESIFISRYEAFMRTFGATNSLQASAQTGDDNLEQDVQTEEIESLTKWTQAREKAQLFYHLKGKSNGFLF